MKSFSIFLSGLALAMSLTGIAGAIPLTFDLAGATGGSSVAVHDSAPLGTLTGTLASNLDNQIFTLADGMTQKVDFFTLTANGLALNSNYTVAATLAFDSPNISATGSGGGNFTTLFGIISGGTLTWNNNSLPDVFTVGGNKISVDFEDLKGFGNTAMVHAFITNEGGGAAPVPEPNTMILLGAGLLGLAIYGKRRMNNEA